MSPKISSERYFAYFQKIWPLIIALDHNVNGLAEYILSFEKL
jgi:hypothetical protein